MSKEILTVTQQQEIHIKTLAKATQVLFEAKMNPETFGVFDSEGFVVLTASEKDLKYIQAIAFGAWSELRAEGLKDEANEVVERNKIL